LVVGIAICSHGVLFIHKGFDTIDHILNQFLFGSSESSSVRDIEDTIFGLRVLSVDTSDLNIVLSGDSFESSIVSHQFWKFDVYGSSQGSTEVGWAGSDVTKMIIVGEFANSLNMSGTSAESLENGCDVGIILHGDDSQLILLINPDKESLGSIVENTSSIWPVSIEVASGKESISLFEEEMIVDELLLDILLHTGQWIEGSCEVTIEGLASLDDLFHDLISLIVGDTWTKRIASEVSSYSDSCGLDHGQFLLGEFSVFKSLGRHIRLVLGIWSMPVIVLDNFIEKLVELGVSIMRSSVDTDA